MDLTYEELEALIDKIAVGKSFLLIDDSFITLIYPDNAIKIKAKHIYDKNYAAALKSGLLPKKDLEVLIKERGIFSEADESQLNRLDSQIDAQKIVLAKTSKVKANQERIHKNIQDLEEKRSVLLYKKYSKLYMSAETKAEEEMNQYLCAMCAYGDTGNKFWTSYLDYLNYSDIATKTEILSAFLDLIRGASMSELRQVARSPVWRVRYTTSVKTSDPLFGKATTDYTKDQLNLVYWSNYYDNIYTMMPADRPPDDVINDDDALDKFMDDYYKELNNETSIIKKDKKRIKGTMSAFDSEEVIITQSSELYYDIKYDKPKEAQKIKDRTDIKKRTKSGR